MEARPTNQDSKRDTDIVADWAFQTVRGERVPNEAGGGLHGRNHGAECIGGAMVFDGIDDYIHVPPHRKIASLSTGTISVWFKFDSIPYGEQNVQPIFYFGDADGGMDNTSLIIEVGHFWDDMKVTALYFTIFGVPGMKPTFCFDSNFDLAVDTWYHFVAVVGEDYNTGFLNGVELTNRNYNFGGPDDSVFFEDVPDAGTCFIGKGYFSNFPSPCHLDGAIDDLRIYREPLDAAAVERLFQGGRTDRDSRESVLARQASDGPWLDHRRSSLQIHPDPLTSAIRIRFSLPERSVARIRVFGVDGRLVTTLMDEEVETGLREVAWDGRDRYGRPAPSGVYFCRLESGGPSLTRKLILSR